MAAVVQLATRPLPQKLRVGIFADTAWQPRWRVAACAKIAACDFAEKSTSANGDLDVAFALDGFDDSRLDGIARLGVWRLHADGVREVVQGAPVTGSSLQVRLAPGAEPKVAYQSWSRTERLSIAANRAHVLGKAAELPVRGLRDAQRYGLGWLEQCKATPDNQGQTTISTARAVTALLKNQARALISILRDAEDQYMALRRASGSVAASLKGFTRLPVKGRMPHLYEGQVFYERDGRIAVLEREKTVFLMEGA